MGVSGADYLLSPENVEKQFENMMFGWLDGWSMGSDRAAVASASGWDMQQQQADSDLARVHQQSLAELNELPSVHQLKPLHVGTAAFPESASRLDACAADAMPGKQTQTPSRQNMPVPSDSPTHGRDDDIWAPKTSEQRKKTKILEKNRRAQKRFREKQKAKMADMEVQLKELEERNTAIEQDKTCLQRQNECLQKVVELRQSQIEALSNVAQVDESDEASEGKEGSVGATAGLKVCLPEGLTLDMCRTMAPAKAMSRWTQYVERLTDVLVEAEVPDPPEESQAKLQKMVSEAGKFVHVLAVVNTHATKELMNCNLKSGLREGDAALTQGEAFWKETIDAISLSEEQQDKVLYFAAMHVKSIKSCHSQREVLARKLVAVLPQTVWVPGSGRMAAAAAAAVDLMADLRKNIHSEHLAWSTFVSAVLVTELTCQQFARLCVRSYPYFPRTFQIARQLAAGKHIPELSGLPDLHSFAASDCVAQCGSEAVDASERSHKSARTDSGAL